MEQRNGYSGTWMVHELTPKERDVLNLFAKGLSYAESAKQLQCSLSTVQTHAKKIYRKLDVHSRSEAVHEAIQLHIVTL